MSDIPKAELNVASKNNNLDNLKSITELDLEKEFYKKEGTLIVFPTLEKYRKAIALTLTSTVITLPLLLVFPFVRNSVNISTYVLYTWLSIIFIFVPLALLFVIVSSISPPYIKHTRSVELYRKCRFYAHRYQDHIDEHQGQPEQGSINRTSDKRLISLLNLDLSLISQRKVFVSKILTTATGILLLSLAALMIRAVLADNMPLGNEIRNIASEVKVVGNILPLLEKLNDYVLFTTFGASQLVTMISIANFYNSEALERALKLVVEQNS